MPEKNRTSPSTRSSSTSSFMVDICGSFVSGQSDTSIQTTSGCVDSDNIISSDSAIDELLFEMNKFLSTLLASQHKLEIGCFEHTDNSSCDSSNVIFELSNTAHSQYHSCWPDLKAILGVLKSLLDKYQILRCSAVLANANALAQAVRDFRLKQEINSFDVAFIQDILSRLGLTISERLSYSLTNNMVRVYEGLHETMSLDDLSDLNSQYTCNGMSYDQMTSTPFTMTNQIINSDQELSRVDTSVSVLLDCVQSWLNYADAWKSYVKKRCNIELKHMQEIKKLNQTFLDSVGDSLTDGVIKHRGALQPDKDICDFFPLHAILKEALKFECEQEENYKSLEKLILSSFDICYDNTDKKRKEITEQWKRERDKYELIRQKYEKAVVNREKEFHSYQNSITETSQYAKLSRTSQLDKQSDAKLQAKLDNEAKRNKKVSK